jgi:hypothetical protein
MKKNIRSTLNFTFVAPTRNHGNTRSKLLCDVTDRILKFRSPSNSVTSSGDSRRTPELGRIVLWSWRPCTSVRGWCDNSDIHARVIDKKLVFCGIWRVKTSILQNCTQVSGHFHFKASNKEPDDQMDMFLYSPDDETSRKSAKTLIHILYGYTNIPSRRSQNFFRKRSICL